MRRALLTFAGALLLGGCYTNDYAFGPYGPYGPMDQPIQHYPGSVPYDEAVRLGIIKDDRPRVVSRSSQSARLNSTPIPKSEPTQRTSFLPDRVVYSQKDSKWGQDKLGKTSSSLAKEGCVVTSVAMALGNLGFNTNPGDLNERLTKTGNFTNRGWLIWNGVAEVTGGDAKATFYDTVSEPLIQSCLVRGDYPLVQFSLPNGRSHWAMVIGRDDKGFHMRDPLRTSNSPLIFPRDASAFKALRCIGLSNSVSLTAH